MNALIFPGQGAQYKGMGASLFEKYKKETLMASEILGYSIKDLCMNDSLGNLGKTQYTQPALFFVNALSFLESKLAPDYLAGHSLGEYNALYAAGAFDLSTGLRLVKKRGELMANVDKEGGMAVIIGVNKDFITNILNDNGFLSIDIANYNTPTQFVISGRKNDLENARPFFENRKEVKLYSLLKVSGAFHSRYMDNAANAFAEYLHNFTFSPIVTPVVSNYLSRCYSDSNIKELLIKQINHSVKWTECIQYLLNIDPEMVFEEIGCRKILTKMVKEITEKQYLFLENKLNKPLENNVVNTEKSCPANSLLDKQDIIEYRDFTLSKLGNQTFLKEYGLVIPYLAGGMYKGISSVEMVVRLAQAGMLGFLGTGGLNLSQIEQMIFAIRQKLPQQKNVGVNVLYNFRKENNDEGVINLCLKYGISIIEVSAYLKVTKSLIKYHAKGLSFDKSTGKIIRKNRIIVKLSRPEIAEQFLKPASESILMELYENGELTEEEMMAAKHIALADCLCVEADSGGHTDGQNAYTLLPAMLNLKNELIRECHYDYPIYVGAAGGIGTPESAASAFILGADFILTGSINQCTVEASTSEVVKDLLQNMDIQDTEYAPAGDLFEFGSKIQVLKRGVLFPVRANKLYELYRHYNSIDEIDQSTKKQIEEKYFKRSCEEVYEEVKRHYSPHDVEIMERNEKSKMAAIFKWYYSYSTHIALDGFIDDVVNFQIHCGPALGAFNRWVKNTKLEKWQNRHVDEIGVKIINDAKMLLNNQLKQMI